MRGGGGVGGPPLRDHPLAGSPVTRNAEIDPGDNDPPPKMTQGVMTPLTNPPSSPSTASLSGVARCWHSNAYFSLFSSLFFFDPPNRSSRFRGTFHSFDPVGFAIFAILFATTRRRVRVGRSLLPGATDHVLITAIYLVS